MQTISLTDLNFENEVSTQKENNLHIKELQILFILFIVIYLREIRYIYSNIHYIIDCINYIYS